MSLTVSATPLAFEIRPSRWMARYVLSVYSLAALTILLVPVSWWAISVALAVLMVFAFLTYHRYVSLRSARAIIALTRFSAGTWQLRTAHGVVHGAALRPDSYVHSVVIVLNFRLAGGGRRSVVLLRDAADATCLRRLRAGLVGDVAEFQPKMTPQ